jgi:site-specific DNA recombinase
MEAVIYLRQSLDRTGAGLAVARQREACEALCTSRGWKIVGVYTDNDTSASGKVARPGFEKAFSHVTGAPDCVLVAYAIDRLTRNLPDLVRLIETDMKVATVADGLDMSTDTGQMVAGILGLVARGEIKRKGTRQVLANQQRALAGKRQTGGNRPFGYCDDFTTVHPQEGPAIEAACVLLLGGGTVSGVAREWSKLGLRPPQAPYGPLVQNPWRRESVRQILMNPAIAGKRAYHGEIVADGDWEPIVSEPTWQAVRALLSDPSRKRPRGVRTLGGGLFQCRCGNQVEGSPTSHGAPGYRCKLATRTNPGPHVSTGMAREIDEYVTKIVIGLLATQPELFTANVEVDVIGLNAEKVAIRTRLEELAGDYALGDLPKSALMKASDKAESRIAELDAQLLDAGRGSVFEGLTGASADAWRGLDLSRQRAVIEALMTVTINPVGRGARRPKVEAIVSVTPREQAG